MNKFRIYLLLLILMVSSVCIHTEQVVAKEAKAKNATYIPVLMYHSFDKNPLLPGINTTPERFKEHLQTLKKNGYKTITNREMELFQSGLLNLPEKSFMITIDDGFESVYQHAFPILKELEMTATFFVITSHIESGERFDVPMASWAQIKEMSDSGYIEIGNHTHDLHWRGNGNQKGYEAMITNATKEGKKMTAKQREQLIVQDIKTAHDLILKNTGIAPTIFSYPYGAYDAIAEKAVKEAGYTIVHTTIEAMNYRNKDVNYIKRFGINNKVSANSLLKKMKTK